MYTLYTGWGRGSGIYYSFYSGSWTCPCVHTLMVISDTESVCACMHVCMYVCMYVCNVCMYVCMYVGHVCMYVYVCMYVCMYVYSIYLYIVLYMCVLYDIMIYFIN